MKINSNIIKEKAKTLNFRMIVFWLLFGTLFSSLIIFSNNVVAAPQVLPVSSATSFVTGSDTFTFGSSASFYPASFTVTAPNGESISFIYTPQSGITQFPAQVWRLNGTQISGPNTWTSVGNLTGAPADGTWKIQLTGAGTPLPLGQGGNFFDAGSTGMNQVPGPTLTVGSKAIHNGMFSSRPDTQTQLWNYRSTTGTWNEPSTVPGINTPMETDPINESAEEDPNNAVFFQDSTAPNASPFTAYTLNYGTPTSCTSAPVDTVTGAWIGGNGTLYSQWIYRDGNQLGTTDLRTIPGFSTTTAENEGAVSNGTDTETIPYNPAAGTSYQFKVNTTGQGEALGTVQYIPNGLCTEAAPGGSLLFVRSIGLDLSISQAQCRNDPVGFTIDIDLTALITLNDLQVTIFNATTGVEVVTFDDSQMITQNAGQIYYFSTVLLPGAYMAVAQADLLGVGAVDVYDSAAVDVPEGTCIDTPTDLSPILIAISNIPQHNNTDVLNAIINLTTLINYRVNNTDNNITNGFNNLTGFINNLTITLNTKFNSTWSLIYALENVTLANFNYTNSLINNTQILINSLDNKTTLEYNNLTSQIANLTFTDDDSPIVNAINNLSISFNARLNNTDTNISNIATNITILYAAQQANFNYTNALINQTKIELVQNITANFNYTNSLINSTHEHIDSHFNNTNGLINSTSGSILNQTLQEYNNLTSQIANLTFTANNTEVLNAISNFSVALNLRLNNTDGNITQINNLIVALNQTMNTRFNTTWDLINGLNATLQSNFVYINFLINSTTLQLLQNITANFNYTNSLINSTQNYQNGLINSTSSSILNQTLQEYNNLTSQIANLTFNCNDTAILSAINNVSISLNDRINNTDMNISSIYNLIVSVNSSLSSLTQNNFNYTNSLINSTSNTRYNEYLNLTNQIANITSSVNNFNSTNNTYQNTTYINNTYLNQTFNNITQSNDTAILSAINNLTILYNYRVNQSDGNLSAFFQALNITLNTKFNTTWDLINALNQTMLANFNYTNSLISNHNNQTHQEYLNLTAMIAAMNATNNTYINNTYFNTTNDNDTFVNNTYVNNTYNNSTNFNDTAVLSAINNLSVLFNYRMDQVFENFTETINLIVDLGEVMSSDFNTTWELINVLNFTMLSNFNYTNSLITNHNNQTHQEYLNLTAMIAAMNASVNYYNTTYLNETNQFINNTYLNQTDQFINNTYLNQTLQNDTFVNDNDTFVNNTYLNQTFDNQTFLNQTLENNTYLNQTFENNTYNNSTVDNTAVLNAISNLTGDVNYINATTLIILSYVLNLTNANFTCVNNCNITIDNSTDLTILETLNNLIGSLQITPFTLLLLAIAFFVVMAELKKDSLYWFICVILSIYLLIIRPSDSVIPIPVYVGWIFIVLYQAIALLSSPKAKNLSGEE